MTPSNRLKAFLNFMDGEDGDLKDFPPGYMEEGFRADLRDTLGRLAAVEEGLELAKQRAAGLSDWLNDNAPFCAVEQKHLDENTPERAYWHYGYLVALRDVLGKITLLTKEQTSG